MLHERLIANEEQLVKLQDKVIHLKQELQSMSAHHTAANVAVSLFAETLVCGLRGFSNVYSTHIVTPTVLKHLHGHNIGILYDKANGLYIMNMNVERVKSYLQSPQRLHDSLQTLWPNEKFELSQTVLIQANKETAFTSQLFNQAHI